MSRLAIPTDEFRALAARVTALCAELLDSLDGAPAFPATSGAEVERLFGGPLPEHGLGGAALDALRDVIAHARLPTPRFFGYVLGSGEPVAAVAGLLGAVLNQHVTA